MKEALLCVRENKKKDKTINRRIREEKNKEKARKGMREN